MWANITNGCFLRVGYIELILVWLLLFFSFLPNLALPCQFVVFAINIGNYRWEEEKKASQLK